MSYYGAGDYYGAGGLGSFLSGVGRAAVGFVTGGPGGAISSAARSIIGSGGGSQQSVPVIRTPGIAGFAQRAIPGGKTGLQIGGGRRKYRRMQYTNMKALRRSERRIDGFVKEVKKSLKHTNYQLVTKGSRRGGRKAPSVIVETGPGGVRA